MSPDRLNAIRSERDLEPALEIARGLIGHPCWDVDAPMESLFLYLGEKREWRGSLIGAWQLQLGDTPWDLLDGERLTARYEELDTREAMREKANVLLDTIVTDLHIDYASLGLTVAFADRFRLIVDPTRIPEGEEDESTVGVPEESQWLYKEAFWSLVTPDHMSIEIGPDRSWRYIRADIPLRDQEGPP